MKRLSCRRASALLLVVFMMVALFASVITAMLVTAGTQVAIHQAQELQRSLADEARIRAMVLALVTDKFEIAPSSSPSSVALVPPLNELIQSAVTGLQGSGTWSIVSQPIETDFGHFSTFPLVTADKISALSPVDSVADYLTPELHALLAGSQASWTGSVVYQFRRTTDHTRDVRIGVRLLSFPLLRAPRLARNATQNKIIYWQPSDLRSDVAVSLRRSESSRKRLLSFALWRAEANRAVFAYGAADSKDFAGRLISDDEPVHDISAAGDLSLLSKFGEPTIGLFADGSSAGALPWIFRQRAAFWIHAPGFIFSGDGLNTYLTYCGVTHTVDLQAFGLAPSLVSSLSGVGSGSTAGEMLIDVGQLGAGTRIISGHTYSATRDAAVIYSESGGSVALNDTGTSAAPAFVLVLAGPSDATKTPLSVTLNGPISRPIILFLYHAQLVNAGGPTSINGAVYCDPASVFNGGAGHELTVASLTYYGGNEASSFWNTVSASAPIPPAIESLAPRVILPISRIL